MWANFQAKQTTLIFLAEICPKIDLALEIQKTIVGIRNSILEISCVPIFRQNKQVELFRPKFAQKWILGSEFQKSKCRFKISTSKEPCVQFLVKMVNFEFFDLNLGKLLNYVQYFGSNNVEGVAEVIPTFLIWRKNNILFSRYLDFCAFVKSTDFNICDIIIGITSSAISTSAYFFWILSTLEKKFDQILVCCKTKISNMFLAQDWRLETSSRLSYNFLTNIHLFFYKQSKI